MICGPASLSQGLSLLALHGLEHLEAAHQRLVDRHHRSRVVKLAAVIRRAEKRDELTLGEELVPILDDLVRAANQVHVHLLQEAGDYIGPEDERDSAVVLG